VGLLAAALAIALASCGGSGETSSPAKLSAQREDLVAVSGALKEAEASVAGEVAATRKAWPLIAHGLPAGGAAIARPPIEAAARSAARVRVPAQLGEAQVASLTGPASDLAGLFRAFSGLTATGWKLIDAAIGQMEHGSPAGAAFAKANVALYIESVYDGQFDLAQVGKHLRDAYRKLGGSAAFGRALTQEEVDALARVYSEPAERLHPHVGLRLGS
jgi:hypothetical protein